MSDCIQAKEAKTSCLCCYSISRIDEAELGIEISCSYKGTAKKKKFAYIKLSYIRELLNDLKTYRDTSKNPFHDKQTRIEETKCIRYKDTVRANSFIDSFDENFSHVYKNFECPVCEEKLYDTLCLQFGKDKVFVHTDCISDFIVEIKNILDTPGIVEQSI